MSTCIDRAKTLLSRFLQGFPLDRTHVCTFNTMGREVEIKHASAAGVEQAFRGKQASGGTDYGAAIHCLAPVHKPPDGEDLLLFYVGDQDPDSGRTFDHAVRQWDLHPVGVALLEVAGGWGGRQARVGDVVERSAQALGIPFFKVTEQTFEDPYAITRTIRTLIAATPVGVQPKAPGARYNLINEILATDLLQRPAWS